MALGEIQGIQKPVVRYARARGWLCWKMEIVGIRGGPDYWFFKNGHVLIVEFKAPGKSRQQSQILRANDLAEQGFHVHVIDDAAAGRILFDSFEDVLK